MNENVEDQPPLRTAAQNLIVDTEKFRASVEQPKGITNVNSFDLSDLRQWFSELEDDEFFHVSCHIEPALKSKIEQGGFVDLNKLLPKNRFQSLNEEQCMHFVNKNGESYLFPAESDQRITGVRLWEQAFRVYVVIYCHAQPHRSSEIWQYVHIINTAAASYNWENVAYYDFRFRQLMAAKPHRSWARTYMQIWNLAMCEPLVKNSSNQSNFSNGSNHTNKDEGCSNWRDHCCW